MFGVIFGELRMAMETRPGGHLLGDADAFGSERRGAARYDPAEDRLWLGWWQTATEYQVVAAVLLNISRTGAAVAVSAAPPVQQGVWLRLDSAGATSSVQGFVLAVEPLAVAAGFRVRLEFHAACPEAFFRLAVEGAQPD